MGGGSGLKVNRGASYHSNNLNKKPIFLYPLLNVFLILGLRVIWRILVGMGGNGGEGARSRPNPQSTCCLLPFGGAWGFGGHIQAHPGYCGNLTNVLHHFVKSLQIE